MSPQLFHFYIHDMPCRRDTDVGQFADDTAMLASSHRTSTIINPLQRAAHSITNYLNKWRIRVNPSKSEACLFTKKRAARHQPNSVIRINGDTVPWANSIKYLGLVLDKGLTFKNHLERKIDKGNKMIKALYPLIGRGSKLYRGFKFLLYKTIIRPTF